MVAIQLDFFKTHEECELDSIRYSIEQVRKSSDKVRKGTHAKINALGKETTDLKARLEILERNICRGIISNL